MYLTTVDVYLSQYGLLRVIQQWFMSDLQIHKNFIKQVLPNMGH